MYCRALALGTLTIALTACGAGRGTPAGPANYMGIDRAVAVPAERIGFVLLSEQNVLIEEIQFSLTSGMAFRTEPYIPLIEAINSRLAESEGLKPIDSELLPFGSEPESRVWRGPKVTFGVPCDTDSKVGSTARNAASRRTISLGGRSRDPRSLNTTTPAAAWREQVSRVAESADVDYILLFGVGDSYYVTDGPAIGRRHLELGTDYQISMSPVIPRNQCWGVLHITAVLVDRTGRVVRAGAEGIIAASTPVATAAAVMDLIPEISIEEIESRGITELREDLEGQPPTWLVATEHLLRTVAGVQR